MTTERLLWGIPEIARYLGRTRSATRLMIDRGVLRTEIVSERVVARVSDASKLIEARRAASHISRWEDDGGR